MLSRALSAQHVVGPDGRVALARDLSAPHDEAAIGLRELIELVVQCALTEKDHAIRATGRRRMDEAFVAGGSQVADREIAAPIARGLADARPQLEYERGCQMHR